MKYEKNGRRIVIAKNVTILDKGGVKITCDIEVDTYIIADVYVKFDKNPGKKYGSHLCEDRTFTKNLMRVLNQLGYKGPGFDRAELGMQGDNYAVFEPNKEFEKFAQDKYGFDLSWE